MRHHFFFLVYFHACLRADLQLCFGWLRWLQGWLWLLTAVLLVCSSDVAPGRVGCGSPGLGPLGWALWGVGQVHMFLGFYFLGPSLFGCVWALSQFFLFIQPLVEFPSHFPIFMCFLSRFLNKTFFACQKENLVFLLECVLQGTLDGGLVGSTLLDQHLVWRMLWTIFINHIKTAVAKSESTSMASGSVGLRVLDFGF